MKKHTIKLQVTEDDIMDLYQFYFVKTLEATEPKAIMKYLKKKQIFKEEMIAIGNWKEEDFENIEGGLIDTVIRQSHKNLNT